MLNDLAIYAGAGVVLIALGAIAFGTLTSRRGAGASLFHRLFVLVAVTAGVFSALSSAIGFSLITSQESEDVFRNAVLPAAFGGFVLFLSVAIWVGGAELVRSRDWFRAAAPGFGADVLFFLERSVKLFIVIPLLASILFFVSTWTTVVGIGGVDAVRHTYAGEITRLHTECSRISAWRQRDTLFLADLRLAVADVERVARAEREGGVQSGSRGRGPVANYIGGVSEWFARLELSVAEIVGGEDPSGVSPYDSAVCTQRADAMNALLARNAHDNIDEWTRSFEAAFNDFANVVNRWRRDRRVEILLDQQLANFERANPKPVGDELGRLSPAQASAVDRYAEQVTDSLRTLIRKQRSLKPPEPLPSAAELSPARGFEIFISWFDNRPPETARRRPRTIAVVDAETIPELSVITPRDAVLKNAQIFSDVWALAIAWDYASYVLLLAFLFFPSAERAAGFKD